MPKALPARERIPKKYTWNAERLFSSPRAWQAELSAVVASIPEVDALKGTLGASAASLADGLSRVESLAARMQRALVYAMFSYSVDTTDQRAAAMNDRAQAALGRVNAAISFVEPELIAMGREVLLSRAAAEPRLAAYRHWLENLFRRQAHVRSPEVEELLGMLADPFSGPGTVSSMLTNADFRFPPAVSSAGRKSQISQGTVGAVMEDRDRKARRSAWEGYMHVHAEHRHTLAAVLGASIKQNTFKCRARRFGSTLEAALFPDDLPVEVFHHAVGVFRRRLPVWHRYFQLRRKTLRLRSLGHFDMWAPLGRKRTRLTYEQTVDLICNGLEPLGRQYVSMVRAGCGRERWVDVLPNQGKREGAFSWGSFGTLPYIMMSFTGDITSLSTLAHELGHSMHSLLAWKTQPYVYSAYSTFVAEVASNLHQALVRASLLRGTDSADFKVEVLEEAMANFFRYLFIMPTLARFELETHQLAERGEPLTAESLVKLMTGLLEEAYGSAVEVEPERDGMLWAAFPHLFEDYYAFQYETGISGAHAIARRILGGEPRAAEDYLRFLSLGSSEYPIEALRVAGVDLSRAAPVEEAFDALDSCIAQLEELLG
jgi:oligoendopeptidase F